MHDDSPISERLRLAEAAVEEFYSACPCSAEVEVRMREMLETGAVVKTGDFKADLVSAYALAIGSPCGSVRQ